MRPVAWSSSYLFRWPFGISTVTSNCTVVVWTTAARRDRRAAFQGVGTIASSGSTIVVTAKTGRFRRRIAMGVIALVLLLIGGGMSLAGAFTGAGGAASDAVVVAEAKLPELAESQPVLASLSEDAPAPDPTALSVELTPLLAAPALGTGVSAQVLDVATGDVLLDQDAVDPA